MWKSTFRERQKSLYHAVCVVVCKKQPRPPLNVLYKQTPRGPHVSFSFVNSATTTEPCTKMLSFSLLRCSQTERNGNSWIFNSPHTILSSGDKSKIKSRDPEELMTLRLPVSTVPVVSPVVVNTRRGIRSEDASLSRANVGTVRLYVLFFVWRGVNSCLVVTLLDCQGHSAPQGKVALVPVCFDSQRTTRSLVKFDWWVSWTEKWSLFWKMQATTR